jgi:hypothetical protein
MQGMLVPFLESDSAYAKASADKQAKLLKVGGAATLKIQVSD